MEFKNLSNEELDSINGGGVEKIAKIIIDYTIGKAINAGAKAVKEYWNNPYPVGSGCSELE